MRKALIVAAAASAAVAASGSAQNRGSGTVSYWMSAETVSGLGAMAAGQGGPAPGQPATAPGQSYTVKAGDTLSKIAKEHYGNANDYMKIFNANTDKLTVITPTIHTRASLRYDGGKSGTVAAVRIPARNTPTIRPAPRANTRFIVYAPLPQAES